MVWFWVEQQRRQEGMEQRAEEAHAEPVFRAQRLLAAELSAATSREVDGAAGGEGTSEDKDKGTSRGKGKSKGKAAGVPRQGGSEAARRVDALEAGSYDATGLEEVDLAERFTQSLLEGASEGY